jgi:hypothetical protein
VTRTAEELSVVCQEGFVPDGVRCEKGWRVFKLEGPFEFSEVGFLSVLAAPLAEAGVGIFAVSTFDTDYVLVKEEGPDPAAEALRGWGYEVRDLPAKGGRVGVRFIRHATFVFEAGGVRVLVAPMLGPAGAAQPVANTPNGRRNPLVGLPFGDEISTLLQKIDAVLVTHTHADHWDLKAQDLISKDTPILCQPEDAKKIEAAGFRQVVPADPELEWGSLHQTRTAGRHGTGKSGAAWRPSPASWSARTAPRHSTLRGIRSGAPR